MAARSLTPPTHCGVTWINGVTDNKTGMRAQVAQTGERLTNRWCREPEDVRAHSTNAWLAGDPSGDTDLHIVYLFENGDRVLFLARVAKSGTATVGCSFVEEVRAPREYECQAKDVASAGGFAFVRFTVLVVRR